MKTMLVLLVIVLLINGMVIAKKEPVYNTITLQSILENKRELYYLNRLKLEESNKKKRVLEKIVAFMPEIRINIYNCFNLGKSRLKSKNKEIYLRQTLWDRDISNMLKIKEINKKINLYMYDKEQLTTFNNIISKYFNIIFLKKKKKIKNEELSRIRGS